MMVYQLDAPTFFKPALELEKVKSVLVSSLPVCNSISWQIMDLKAQSYVMLS